MTDAIISKAKAFVAAVKSGAPAATIASFLAADVVQEEFPNRLLPQGARRDREAILQAMERGRSVLSAQSFEVVSVVASGNVVALETIWTGTLAIGLGNLRPGDVMRARFAQFFEFRDGLIVNLRNYDCFDPR